MSLPPCTRVPSVMCSHVPRGAPDARRASSALPPLCRAGGTKSEGEQLRTVGREEGSPVGLPGPGLKGLQ